MTPTRAGAGVRRPSLRGAGCARSVLAVLVAAVAALTACGGADPPSSDGAASSDEAAATCEERTHPPPEDGGHLIGDQGPPVPYRSTPPTSGWHTSGHTPVTVQPPDEPLSGPRQVSVLEAGGVVVTYHELAADEREALERHVRENHRGTVAVTPYDELGADEVVFTAWGVRQRCRGFDAEALDAFVEAHAEEDVDGGH